MSDESHQKKKYFRIDDELCLKFEIQARKFRISETKLIARYIKEGLERDEIDKNQMTLDEELEMNNKK